YPGDANLTRRKNERKGDMLLQVCDHLASGLKHFELRPHHDSVKSTHRGGGSFGADSFAARSFASRSFGRTRLVVTLDGAAAQVLGSSSDAVTLAGKVLEFWESHPELAKCPP